MTTKNYKTAIDILTTNAFDAKKIAIELAKSHPAIFVQLVGLTSVQPVAPVPTLVDEWHLDVIRKLYRCEKVAAIKQIREHTGCGLKEAKDIADYASNYMNAVGYQINMCTIHNTSIAKSNQHLQALRTAAEHLRERYV